MASMDLEENFIRMKFARLYYERGLFLQLKFVITYLSSM